MNEDESEFSLYIIYCTSCGKSVFRALYIVQNGTIKNNEYTSILGKP